MILKVSYERRAGQFNLVAIPGYWKTLDALGAPGSPFNDGYSSDYKCGGRKNSSRLIGEISWNQQSFFQRQGE